MKIVTVIGARPQFIKAAVVSRAFAEQRLDVRKILVHTGQHYDGNTSDAFFDQLNIPRSGCGRRPRGQNIGRMIKRLEELMLVEKPDWVMVYGDTELDAATAHSGGTHRSGPALL